MTPASCLTWRHVKRRTRNPATWSAASRRRSSSKTVGVRCVRRRVRFDDETAIGPKEVDLVASDRSVHERPREPSLADERQEALLELAAGDLGLGSGEGG